MEKDIEKDPESKLRQKSQEKNWVEPVVRALVANQQLAKTIAADTTLLKRLACDDSLASGINLRLRETVLKNAFLQDLTNAILKTKGHQFNNLVTDKCHEFLERKRILMRVERVEDKLIRLTGN